MRVLHLIDTGGPGGAETILHEVATGLDARAWESVVAVPERDWLDRALRGSGVEPLLVPTEGAFDLGYLVRLARVVRQRRIDIIHAHLLTTSVYGSLVGRILGLPVVCTFHGEVDVSSEDTYRAAKFRIVSRGRNRVVFVSETLRRTFLSSTPLDPSITRVVHNGIDTGVFRPGRDDTLRVELGVNDGEVLIGAVGNLRVAKDYPNLLRAAALLRQRSPRYRFVIAGDTRTPMLQELLELRRQLGLEGALSFVGFRDDVPRFLRALDLYLISSSAEGFSLSTVQALASGVPVVATRCGGPEEILEGGEVGVLVPPRDPGAIADAVHALSHDRERQARFRDAGRSLAETRFSRRAMVAGYEAVYREILGAHGWSSAGSSDRHAAAGVAG